MNINPSNLKFKVLWKTIAWNIIFKKKILNRNIHAFVLLNNQYIMWVIMLLFVTCCRWFIILGKDPGSPALCHNVSSCDSHWSPCHQSWRLVGSDWPHLSWHKEPWWWGEATVRICVRLREVAKKGDNPNIVTSYPSWDCQALFG